MWMPQQIPAVADRLKAAGLELEPSALTDLTGFPMGAIVAIPGCTASFVSDQGLAVTNHHCAYGSISYNATPENDILRNGFLAANVAEEIPAAPGTRIWVTTSIEDVTGAITDKLPASGVARLEGIDRRIKSMIDECEAAGAVRCSVPAFFEGSQYLRITQMEIRDVRLVYAPAEGIGVFGGDTDNWMWPRHTGDWAFLRAYVGPDGKSADYAKENVPFRPRHWLRISTDGVDERDFVMVAGYPGRTYRYRTADEVANSAGFFVPTTIDYATRLIETLQKENERSKEVELANINRIRSLSNLQKNYQGTSEVFASGKIQQHRTDRENALRKLISEDAAARRQFGGVLDEISRINEVRNRTRQRDLLLSWIFRSSPILNEGSTLYELALEREKADVERKSGYRERDWERLRQGVERTQRSIEPASDRAGLRLFLRESAALPADQRITPVDRALAATGRDTVEEQVDALLDRLYGNTELTILEARNRMFSESAKALRAREDSMLQFAIALTDFDRERSAQARERDAEMSSVRPQYLAALRQLAGGEIYPDANSTLRITWGHVRGYSPRDAVVYTPQTTLAGLLRKDTGEGEFESPASLLEAAADTTRTRPYVDPEIEDVPVNFLSTVDTTGGNSGSPTLDSKGRLVGLLFDGNYEALGSDYLHDEALTRSIHVDAVYLLWVMDAVDGAHNLLREMKLPVRTPVQ